MIPSNPSTGPASIGGLGAALHGPPKALTHWSVQWTNTTQEGMRLPRSSSAPSAARPIQCTLDMSAWTDVAPFRHHQAMWPLVGGATVIDEFRARSSVGRAPSPRTHRGEGREFESRRVRQAGVTTGRPQRTGRSPRRSRPRRPSCVAAPSKPGHRPWALSRSLRVNGRAFGSAVLPRSPSVPCRTIGSCARSNRSAPRSSPPSAKNRTPAIGEHRRSANTVALDHG